MLAPTLSRRAFTLVEIIVVIAIITVLAGLMLPAVQYARGAAYKASCQNNLRQMGVAVNLYHDFNGSLPPGYVATNPPQDRPEWGWGALLLPYMEQPKLASLTEDPLNEVALELSNHVLLAATLEVYTCPADFSRHSAHQFRYIETAGEMASIEVPKQKKADLPAFSTPPPITSPGCPFCFPPKIDKPKNKYLPPPLIDPAASADPPVPPVPLIVVRLSKSNYVASFGSGWNERNADWSSMDFEGNGLFGRNSKVTWGSISDGTSFTYAIGERGWKNYGAVWVGVNSARGCGFVDNQMVLATAFYPLNDAPITANIDCDGQGAANFSSAHAGGANFLIADGSVSFVSEYVSQVVFKSSAQRNDR